MDHVPNFITEPDGISVQCNQGYSNKCCIYTRHCISDHENHFLSSLNFPEVRQQFVISLHCRKAFAVKLTPRSDEGHGEP